MAGPLLQRLLDLFRKPSATGSPAFSPEELTKEVVRLVRREVAAGFSGRAEIAGYVKDSFAGEMGETAFARLVDTALDAALADQRRAQLSWPGMTDCDRLDAAFLSLEEAGIIARQNYSCCGTCGAGEIWAELTNARNAGKAVRGYAFYHMQDTERAVEGDGLYLNYGGLEDTEAAELAIADDIVATLKRSGLETRWNGSRDQRIRVTLDWKRRLPA